MLWKCCNQYASKLGKLTSGHRTGKDQFSFQSQRKAMPKKVQTTVQLTHLISYASKVMLKTLWGRLQQYVNHELPDVQAGFRKGRGTRDEIVNIRWIIKKTREFQKDISVQFSLVTQLCPTLCDPMDCSTPGFPVHHQLLKLTQTQPHRVSDAIQPSHPLSSPSPPTFNLSQQQGLFQWVSSSHQVAKHQSFQCIFRTDFF